MQDDGDVGAVVVNYAHRFALVPLLFVVGPGLGRVGRVLEERMKPMRTGLVLILILSMPHHNDNWPDGL